MPTPSSGLVPITSTGAKVTLGIGLGFGTAGVICAAAATGSNSNSAATAGILRSVARRGITMLAGKNAPAILPGRLLHRAGRSAKRLIWLAFSAMPTTARVRRAEKRLGSEPIQVIWYLVKISSTRFIALATASLTGTFSATMSWKATWNVCSERTCAQAGL